MVDEFDWALAENDLEQIHLEASAKIKDLLVVRAKECFGDKFPETEFVVKVSQYKKTKTFSGGIVVETAPLKKRVIVMLPDMLAIMEKSDEGLPVLFTAEETPPHAYFNFSKDVLNAIGKEHAKRVGKKVQPLGLPNVKIDWEKEF